MSGLERGMQQDDRPPPLIGAGWQERLRSTTKVAVSSARLVVRRARKKSGDVDLVLGERLAGELDRMKGLAMKVGQIFSYFDGILPDEARGPLSTLQYGLTTMPYTQVSEIIRAAFGEPVETLFEDFRPNPVAGASIGQVHRAVYEGRPVAVKVQYPGIKENIDRDFSRVRPIASLIGASSVVDAKAIADELRERMLAECAYIAEARAQDAFHKAYADDPEIRIPAAIPKRTRANVLTTEWADGKEFASFAEAASADERAEAAETMLRFAYRSFFEFRTVNADPHPGNYFFPEDGSVVFIDFGCIRRFSDEFVDAERHLAEVVIEDRESEFRDAMMATGMITRESDFDIALHWRMLCHQYAPFRSESFKFTPDYVRQALEFSGSSNRNLRSLAISPEWIWLARLQWGLNAVLGRLGAEGSFGHLMTDVLRREPKRLEIGGLQASDSSR